MTRYAQRTEVGADKSRAEIERTLMRYGAKAFHYGWQENRAMIAFELEGRYFKIDLPLPDKNDEQFQITPSRGYQRTPEAALAAWEQATRQRWRALALWVKAVLEATESGITTLEQALMPYIVLPDKSTVAEWMLPQIEKAYETGQMPKLLPLLA
ncbi:MAG: hypothetical protein RBR16_13515 [Syntrophus sp. (in: bacteria)]|nr:hypothetical protein [Syntrophus sp. (in: bacteria)]